jgi:hypothetical protein
MFSRAQQHFRMRWHRPLANQHQGKGPQEVPNGSASQFAALLSAATEKKEGVMPHAYFLSRICSGHSLISKMCTILAERFKARAVRIEVCEHVFMVHYASLSNRAALS